MKRNVIRNLQINNLFVNLLSENIVVFDKSRVPKVVIVKKDAWDNVHKQYSSASVDDKTMQKMMTWQRC